MIKRDKNPIAIMQGRKYDFSDEGMLVVGSPQGLVLVTGCSHPGIANSGYRIAQVKAPCKSSAP